MGFFDNVQADKRYIKREELRGALKSKVDDEVKNLVSEIYKFIDNGMNQLDIGCFETPQSITEIEEAATVWFDYMIRSSLNEVKGNFSGANIKYYGTNK